MIKLKSNNILLIENWLGLSALYSLLLYGMSWKLKNTL
jgi:hypothetical protein